MASFFFTVHVYLSYVDLVALRVSKQVSAAKYTYGSVFAGLLVSFWGKLDGSVWMDSNKDVALIAVV